MRTHFRVFAVSILLAAAGAAPASAQDLEGRVVEHRLGNGMTLLILERHAAPVVSAVIRYRVGSVDEEPGKTGLAHLYEHLAFRGTEIVGTTDYAREVEVRARIDSLSAARASLAASRPDASGLLDALDRAIERENASLDSLVVVEELDQIYNVNGAVNLSANTTADLTTFGVDLPANRLALWAVLEADRMVHGVPRGFEVEREICAREQHSHAESDPESALYGRFLETAFETHPYRREISGCAGDLESVTAEDAAGFYHAYYAPGNAVAAIVGDVEAEHVIALAETTFGRIAPRAPAPRPDIPAERPQTKERRTTVELDAEPALFVGFHKPNVGPPSPGDPPPVDLVFELLGDILTRGERSRLHRALFLEKGIGMDFSSWIGPGDRYPNLFTIAARPIHPHTPEEVLAAIWAEVDRLRREPVSEEELRRAKNRLAADFLRGLEKNRGLANWLSYWETLVGDWRYLEERVELIERIGPEDVRDCAARYFTRENSTAAFLVRGAGER
jgi:predicted Zn-dependent peptidase